MIVLPEFELNISTQLHFQNSRALAYNFIGTCIANSYLPFVPESKFDPSKKYTQKKACALQPAPRSPLPPRAHGSFTKDDAAGRRDRKGQGQLNTNKINQKYQHERERTRFQFNANKAGQQGKEGNGVRRTRNRRPAGKEAANNMTTTEENRTRK